MTEFQLFSRIKEKNIVLREYNKELSEYSFSDALTGVNNRRRIEDILRKEWKSCKASYHNLSIIFIDIDNFKKYNDYYGHVEGDACLIKVALAIEELCSKLPKSKNCSMGRYGGEEFIVILPKCDKESALCIAKKITEKIESLSIPHEKNEGLPYVTISCGVTTMVPDDHKRILYILESADQALYHVKKTGKNNAMHFSDLMFEGVT
jgi:diguanylate cyclase (GGDEF)-like protein